MIGFVIAYLAEAKKLIKLLDLKRVEDKFVLFSNSNFVLIISSSGEVSSSVATTYLLTKFKIDYLINYGIAGSIDRKCKIGDLFLINRVSHIISEDELYPDIVYDTSIYEAEILCTPIALDQNSSLLKSYHKNCPNIILVDMESYGFIKAAFEFISPHQVLILKVVSDFLEPDSIDIKNIDLLLDDSSTRVQKLAQSLLEIESNKKEIFTDFEVSFINKAIANFSHSQKEIIVEHLKYKKILNINILEILNGHHNTNRRDIDYKNLLEMLKIGV